LKVNGESFLIENLKEATILSLLDHYSLNKTRVAIEINGQIIKRDNYDQHKLVESDVIEIIHFVGGGAGGGRN